VGDTKKTKGRDAEGKPLLVLFEEKVTDWWGRWRMPSFNLWGYGSVTAAQAKGDTADKSTYATGGIPFTKEKGKLAHELVRIALEQTEYVYSAGTAGTLSQLSKGTFAHESGEKPSGSARGLCYTYVKVALSRANIISPGFLADHAPAPVQESASLAGPELEKRGFQEITGTRHAPDARWAGVGDVIVYAWSDQTWQQRKNKKKNPKLPNHGHIDIRSEDGYISDFYTKHPTWVTDTLALGLAKSKAELGYCPNYLQVKIYRKSFDPTPTLRIRAFLRCLREIECTGIPESKRYYRLNAALPSAPKDMYMTSLEVHPWSKVPEDQRPTVADSQKGVSSAAGAYQITLKSWSDYFKKGYFPDMKSRSFSEQVQDRIAVMMLEGANVLSLVRQGKIADALKVKALLNSWSSLPGGVHNTNRVYGEGKTARKIDQDLILELFETYLAEEKKKEGLQ
jgi:muramidase (phage lysozyme)